MRFEIMHFGSSKENKDPKLVNLLNAFLSHVSNLISHVFTPFFFGNNNEATTLITRMAKIINKEFPVVRPILST